MATPSTAEISANYKRIALVLQGGGALGAYQVGIFRALDEAGYMPDWIAGTSIGAINASIIAGNAPEDRLAKLKTFWERIETADVASLPAPGTEARRLESLANSFRAMTCGQPGFFRPRPVSPWLAKKGTPEALSFYDTGALHDTLTELIDFDRINNGGIRLSLGAVHIKTGAEVFFDNKRTKIGPEHIMASGALPPGLPPVEIDGEMYWDGGIVSNTPLDVVLDDDPRVSTLCFMADLFDPNGPEPKSIDEVVGRHKDIAYSSRSKRHIESYRAIHNMRRMVNALWTELPDEVKKDPEIERMRTYGCTTTMNIVHFTYRCQDTFTVGTDYDFSATALKRHRETGYADAMAEIAVSPWAKQAPEHMGVVVHELAQAAE